MAKLPSLPSPEWPDSLSLGSRRAVYGPIDHAGLRLITCGGTYDTARRKYLDNVIVFAKLESVRAG